MPNRILRDWTDSETIDKLSIHAERFFTRLIMKVDDYGRYTANVKMLKSTLFPLKTDVRETDIALWLTECKQCGLIALYDIAMRDYLQIENFNQRLRQKTGKYPGPGSSNTNDGLLTDNRPLETKRSRNEVEVVAPTASPQQQTDSFLFGLFKNCSNWKTELILQELGKFKNKYPELPLNKSGPVVNAWVTNYKPINQKLVQKETPRYNFSQNGIPGRK